MAKRIECPKCGGPLESIRQGRNSMLNSDQFDAVKAGDYWCPACPDNGRGAGKLCYWWERELPDAHDYQI